MFNSYNNIQIQLGTFIITVKHGVGFYSTIEIHKNVMLMQSVVITYSLASKMKLKA